MSDNLGSARSRLDLDPVPRRDFLGLGALAAAASGLNVGAFEYLFLVLVALTIVVSLQAVGIILVVVFIVFFVVIAAVFNLAAALPREQAESLVKRACAIAVAQNRPLVHVIEELAGDAVKPGAVDWQALADPANYLGETDRIIERVLAQAKKQF